MGLAAEVARLREQLEREQAETHASVSQFSKRIDNITQENKKLQSKLMRSQLRESAKESEVAVVKKEVLEKTAAIEQVMRDLQQKQQATLSRVKNVASAMLATCTGTPPRERMERTPPRERNRSPPSPEQPIRRVSADVPLSAANFS